MMRIVMFAALFAALSAGPAAGQIDTAAVAAAGGGLAVDEMVFCLGVEEMAPVGGNSQFFEPVDRICCFTRIAGAGDTTTVTHVWYFGEEEMARVDLTVKSASWRTWSCKTMIETWAGAWRVDVLGPGGEVLLSREFIYKPVGE
ncbi:MAG: DUF2914 domain-containing protein [Candidatus Krumholzibacteria bacterium]|nr:DUF2914 domain-containing protein [Candidatus Krumholzibacteria bacterium]